MGFDVFYHQNSHKIFFWLFIFTFVAQVFFWQKTENIKPYFEIVTPAPNPYIIQVFSLGDPEFLFRILAVRLQNSGDVFAGFTGLKNYDYARIYEWMLLLDELNPESNLVPALASYYYSQTQNKADNKYIVDYLDIHSAKNIDANWWWLVQAVYIAKNNLGNINRALNLAYKLSRNNAKNAPFWTKEMPAFIHEEKGEGCMAFAVIAKLIKESENGTRQIEPQEMNFIRYFINERLTKLQQQKFSPKQCTKNL
jgi:hypothetical protein